LSFPHRGVVVPMITPFTPAGAIDEPAIGRIVNHLVNGGVNVFPLGTTGESASIHGDDKRRVVEAVVKHAGGRATVYAGIAGTCFRESVELAKAFKQLGGITAVVAHPPSYYPLSDDEIESYFLRLADSVALPLVLYNIPATTHHSIALDTVDRLGRHANIVAIKDSSGDRPRLSEMLKRTGGRGGFPVLLGSSASFSHGLRAGAVGLVPSGAHLVPREYQAMYEAAMNDRWDDVERLQSETDAVCAQYLKGHSLAQGLAALKAILEQRGLCGRTMLPPLRDHVGNV
jgi:dihydrodipicolinate synthase/N-acetylneuraminate lyase